MGNISLKILIWAIMPFAAFLGAGLGSWLMTAFVPYDSWAALVELFRQGMFAFLFIAISWAIAPSHKTQTTITVCVVYCFLIICSLLLTIDGNNPNYPGGILNAEGLYLGLQMVIHVAMAIASTVVVIKS